MKMTVEIDERRLAKVMKLTGIKTKTKALDFALIKAEKAALLDKLLSEPPRPEDLRDSIEPAFDIQILRARDLPKA